MSELELQADAKHLRSRSVSSSATRSPATASGQDELDARDMMKSSLQPRPRLKFRN